MVLALQQLQPGCEIIASRCGVVLYNSIIRVDTTTVCACVCVTDKNVSAVGDMS